MLFFPGPGLHLPRLFDRRKTRRYRSGNAEETEGENARDRDGIFFKSVKLTGNKRAFSFYVNGNGQYLYFRIYEFSKNSELTEGFDQLTELEIFQTNFN